MQGRLVPPEGGRFQSFPRERWCDEFPRAAQAGIDYIEWIYDAYGEALEASGRPANPMLSAEGLTRLDALKQKYCIGTPALCADWFMDNPLLRCSQPERARRERHLHDLIPLAKRIEATRIILPFVDQSRINDEDERHSIVEIIEGTLPILEQHNIEIHLETDLQPSDFAALLAQLPHPLVKANWDSGNSSGLGYIASEEFAAYGDRIGSIHIKDRRSKYAGGIATMPLGTGSADFDDVFASMKKIDYNGDITLQVARGEDDDEVAWIASQLAFIQKYWQ